MGHSVQGQGEGYPHYMGGKDVHCRGACLFGVQGASHTRCVIQVVLSPRCTLWSTWPFVLLPQELPLRCPPRCINPSPLTQQGGGSVFGLVQGWGSAKQMLGLSRREALPLFTPRNPASAGWGSFLYAPPRGWLRGPPRPPSLRYADLCALTLFPRGSGAHGEAVAAAGGEPGAAPAPPASGPGLPPCPAGCRGNRTGLLMSPGRLLRDRSVRPSPREVTVAMATGRCGVGGGRAVPGPVPPPPTRTAALSPSRGGGSSRGKSKSCSLERGGGVEMKIKLFWLGLSCYF